MKKNIFLVLFSIASGIIVTFFILNKEQIYSKEEYLVYAFQTGAYETRENAYKMVEKIPSGIIVPEDNYYKVYAAIFKDIDIVNKMVVYLENNNINVYLKTIQVNKDFYHNLENYEKIINSSDEASVYNKVNQSILNLYLESKQNVENNQR